MESVDQIMNQIKKETEPAASAAMYLCCPLCETTSILNPTNPIPGACYACQKPTSFGTGPTPNAAKEKAASMATKQPQPAAQLDPAPTKPAEVNSQTVISQQAPAPTAPRQRVARARAPVVTEQPPVASAAQPVTQQVPQAPMTTADFKQARLAAVASFIQAKQLNQVDTKVVGKAVVYAVGFTQWVNADDGRQVPSYTMCDPADDPSIYQAAKQKARQFDGKIMNDVALLTNLPDDLLPMLYNAELFASTVGKHGRVSCKPEDPVEVGARLSQSGSIIWSVVRKLV